MQGIHKRMVRFQKLLKMFSPHPTRTQQTLSAAGTVQVSVALPAVRFSCSLRGRGATFQDGVAAGEGFLCAPFWGVQICDYSAAWVFVHGLKKTPRKNTVFCVFCYSELPWNKEATKQPSSQAAKPADRRTRGTVFLVTSCNSIVHLTRHFLLIYETWRFITVL
jgi:hypothetical protein